MFGVGCWMHGHPIITGRMAGGRLPLLLMLLAAEMAPGHVVGTAVSLPPSRAASVPVCVLPRWMNRISAPSVRQLQSRDDFTRELSDAKQGNALLIVKLSHPQCRTCRAMQIKLSQLARQRPQLRIFDVDVSTDEGAAVARMAGGFPKQMPTIAVFDRGELVYCEALIVSRCAELKTRLDAYEKLVESDPQRLPSHMELMNT